ncbi:branched-chain amino acid ABC transporter permease [Zafaria cholistanensis]|uniref:Branched-chain amino acid ABC transporter permease n=1 Tax=Zafaria cholistanensis TaxID=1682741 RepID=A0A5A7NRJ0_9MICC|nr:branched-chain amino acid ABC transporter permease [Zafaria cholistanensis]GER23176.1 branched-chain amino acid ABC transporter permease [Zafaria cholistanensis]
MALTETAPRLRPVRTGQPPARRRDDSRLCRTRTQRILLAVAFVAIVAFPLSVESAFLISLTGTIGIFALAALGLNILSGYAGQISLAQSIFVGIGAFAGVALGGLAELPLLVWLPGTFVAGGLAAALVAPLTLRLKGVFQIVLSLALIFVGHYAFINLPALTGGNGGISATPSLSLGFIDFGELTVAGMRYSYEQGLFILIWLVLAASMIAVVNMHRTRFGRALVAVREAETAAEIAGINAARVKVQAFVLAGAFAGLAGGLLMAQLRYVQAEQFGINMGLELLIIVVVGGLGTTWGPVVGAAVISSIPVLATQYAEHIPFLQADFSQSGEIGIPVGQVGLLIYGLALVLVMVFEPRGLSHIFGAGGRSLLRLARRARTTSEPVLVPQPHAHLGGKA